MHPTNMLMDRREYPRIKAKNDIPFLIITQNSRSGPIIKRGEIIDISMGGLAFYYTQLGKSFSTGSHLGTLFGHDDLWLHDIPIKTVSDCLVNGSHAAIQARLRRRSVKFHRLTSRQKKDLQQYIWLNTTEEF